MKRFLFFLVFFIGCLLSNAQYFQTGQDPASIKWRQINSENFQLIYPDYYEQQAQKLTYVLEKIYEYGTYSLNYKPKKISIILHTQTVKSNGLVALAPKRAEFYTTPHQGIYPQDWLEQLAIHEFRHVVQVDKIEHEMPRILKALFGQQGTALVFGAYLPWWFIEGDAVVTETALSNYGRGRFPSFLMEHKAQVVEKGVYSYDKAYNGSLKSFVPNHYKLGYFLVGNTRERYGADTWESVLWNVAKHPLSFNPFNSALKKETGFNKVKLYYSVFDSLRNVWQKENHEFESIPFQIVSPENKKYTNYTYNHWLNSSTIISYKTSLNTVAAFVSIDKNGKEKKLYTPGAIFSESVNYTDDLIIWSEQIPNPRWAHSGKSLIRIFNVDSKKIVEFKTVNKSFSPSISPDKTKVAVVETDFSNNYFISIYSIKEGSLLNRIQTKNNNYFFSPEWINENELAVVLLYENGKRLAKLNLENKIVEILINKDLGEIKQLKVSENHIFFISSYSGKNSLYSYNLNTGETKFIYEPRFGVESPAISPDKGKIILSDYSSDGFRLIQILDQNENVKLLEEIKQANYKLADKLAEQEKGIPDFKVPENITYESKKYNKSTHLLNFHSWAPVFIDIQNFDVVPGASIMSQNKLGTAETILGYKWDIQNKTGKYYANYTFKGWYPVISIEGSYGKSASKYYEIIQTKNSNGEIVNQDTSLQRFTWNIANAELDIRIPLNFSKGKFLRLFQPEFQYNLAYYKHDESTPESFFYGNLQTLSYRLYYYQLLRKSVQDVYPNFGIIVDGNYQHTPVGTANLGNIATVQSYLYLPGFLRNHGTRFYGGFQTKDIGESYNFSDAIKYPRGWGKINTTEMVSLGADYKLPLFYPDWNLASFIYLRRIKASLFADYALLKGSVYENSEITGTFSKNISSLGIELTGDVNFLRFYAPANIGVRASYLPELDNVYFDFLFSIDLTTL